MGFGTALHYVGTFMLLVATVFMIVASISPPALNSLAMLKVHFNGANGGTDNLYYGVFGYCTTGENGSCSGPRIGYYIGNQVDGIDGINISRASERTMHGLSYAFILHPIAAGVSFIAFIFSLKTGFLNLITTIIALFAFFLAVINLGIDFACFSKVRYDVNNDSDTVTANWGPAIWLVVGAAIANLVGAVIVFLTCCAGRRQKKYENRKVHGGY